jgi:hypothetical protein
MDNTLLPCPFCGNKDVRIDKFSDEDYSVICTDFGCHAYLCEGGGFSKEIYAIKAWNRRVQHER